MSALREALELTERNLGSLIAAKHHDANLMTEWREVVRQALQSAEFLEAR